MLAKSLKDIDSLDSINLKGNFIESEGGEALLFLLRENRSITKLYLEQNLVR